MPQDCCVPMCRNRKGGHKFPITPERNLKWRIAIRRVDPISKKLWEPGDNHVVCGDHFRPEDYDGSKRRRLLPGTVPSIFPFCRSNTPRQQSSGNARAEKRRLDKSPRNNDVVIVPKEDDQPKGLEVKKSPKLLVNDASIQCSLKSPSSHSIHNFVTKPTAVHYLTGFGDYQHFMWFFNVLLGTGLKPDEEFAGIRPEDQLFLTMLKLRQAFDHKYLAILFDLPDATVTNVFSTWIRFIYHCFKKLYTWPSKKTVKDTMPISFKTSCPTARIIIDITDIAIESSADANLEERNTLKFLVGVTPAGVLSYVSECFCGAASDREVMEKSDLYINAQTLFEPGDTILADREVLVQDLFAPFNIMVNTPFMLTGKSQLDPTAQYAGEGATSSRVRIEEATAYAKTYKLLQSPIPYQFLPLSNMIVYICFFLTNYRCTIVREKN